MGTLNKILWFLIVFGYTYLLMMYTQVYFTPYLASAPVTVCAQGSFYVEETDLCVPFRNDQQEFLFNTAGSTSKIQ